MTDVELIRWAAGVVNDPDDPKWIVDVFGSLECDEGSEVFNAATSDDNYLFRSLAVDLLKRYVQATTTGGSRLNRTGMPTHSWAKNIADWHDWWGTEKRIRAAIVEGPLAVIGAIHETGVLDD